MTRPLILVFVSLSFALLAAPGLASDRTLAPELVPTSELLADPFWWAPPVFPLSCIRSTLAADQAPPNDEPNQPGIPADNVAPAGEPHVSQCVNSGCLTDGDGRRWMCEDDDLIEFIVEEQTLSVLHTNANYNCCLDAIVVSMEIVENRLLLTEQEVAEEPCWCICCYDAEATIVGLPSGEYAVEFSWYDYDTDETRCVVGDIVIP